MKREMLWHSFEREDLPNLLLGESQLPHYSRSHLSKFDLDKNRVAIGYATDHRGRHFSNPSLIVVHEDNSDEILSWLRVYAPETSPLSQLSRVVNFEDWSSCENTEPTSTHPIFTYHWACLTIGEMLAQSESESDINTIPLSRAQAAYTNTVAKATILHEDKKITRSTINRLKTLEQEYRFVKRSVSVDDLRPMWDLLEDFRPDPRPSAELIINLIERIESSNFTSTRSLIGPRIRNYPGLLSDSIEERVITFHKLATEILDSPTNHSLNAINCATLSAAAFLVGRGTSHIFLLRKWNKEFPASLAWFGLFAAYVGPNCWDPQWARAVKSIERPFQSNFDWMDLTQTDLCWPEYFWLSKTYEGHEVFSDLPKMYPRVLSIEVFPGASCQFRLLSSTTSVEIDSKKQPNNSKREKELQFTLNELVSLAVKAKNLMVSDHRENRQESFQLEESNSGKDTRSKRGGRPPSSKS